MTENVPTFTELTSVYGVDGTPAAQERYAWLSDGFTERFGSRPALFARSPGRVNLIGEHIDYEGYAVLPMAIRQDTVVAIKQGGDDLTISNMDETKYPTATFSIDPKQRVDLEHHTWANYFLAAYKGVFEYLEKQGKVPAPVGLQVMLHGQVPTGSGLSSSAAFVCSSSLAVLATLGISVTKSGPAPEGLCTCCAGAGLSSSSAFVCVAALALLAAFDVGNQSKTDVAEFTTTCERYVGTESGGMDQAISMMGMPQIAKLIEFNPIRASDVVLPEGAVFVIANSLTVSNKAETAAGRYNMRVVECKLAAAVLAVTLGMSKEKAIGVRILKEVEELAVSKLDKSKQSASDAPCQAAKHFLHEAPYEQAEIEGLLGTSLTKLFEDNPSQQRSIPVAAKAGGFKLQQRTLHVFAEAQRVRDFQKVCNNAELSQDDKLKQLGDYMDASQASCRDLYECSCEELDTLIAECKKQGALGSRLTGAGWGGCTVSLIKQADAAHFITAIKSNYFEKCIKDGKVKSDQLEEVIFASKPASGGAIIKLQM
ncbi:hypothetical protein WJX77_001255 [Trebouxia sp. C0004]